eukprot:m.55759 g.55759  ORF g.55759 m.55759 type:complete len:178 (+) comp11986_c1_seq1:3388-3921(+)
MNTRLTCVLLVLCWLGLSSHAAPLGDRERDTISTNPAPTTAPTTFVAPTSNLTTVPTTETTTSTTTTKTEAISTSAVLTTTTAHKLPATPDEEDNSDEPSAWSRTVFIMVVVISLVVLLFFMMRYGLLSKTRAMCCRQKYRALAVDNMGSMELSRLSAADTQDIDDDEEETIFDSRR